MICHSNNNSKEYYIKLCNMNDRCWMMLIAMDRACNAAIDMVKEIQANGLYRHRAKVCCDAIYQPKGNSYSPQAMLIGKKFNGYASLITHMLDINMSRDERIAFSNVRNDVSQCLNIDTLKLYNAIAIGDKPKGVRNENVYSKLVASLCIIVIAKNVITNTQEYFSGNRIFLCKDKEAKSPFELSTEYVDALLLSGCRLVKEACNTGFDMQQSKILWGGIKNVFEKMIDIRTIYPACFHAGIDLRKTSLPLMEEYSELIDAIIVGEVPRYTSMRVWNERKSEQKLESDFYQSLEDKGWRLV